MTQANDPNDGELRDRASRIRLLCLDVDGVLTDGAMYYDRSGEALKRFHTRDAAGLALVRKAGIEVAWISAEDSAITAARAGSCGFRTCAWAARTSSRPPMRCGHNSAAQWDALAYMGDDWFDMPLLERVGLSACPAERAPLRAGNRALRLPPARRQWRRPRTVRFPPPRPGRGVPCLMVFQCPPGGKP